MAGRLPETWPEATFAHGVWEVAVLGAGDEVGLLPAEHAAITATVRSAQNTANMALFMWGSAPLVLVGVDLPVILRRP